VQDIIRLDGTRAYISAHGDVGCNGQQLERRPTQYSVVTIHG